MSKTWEQVVVAVVWLVSTVVCLIGAAAVTGVGLAWLGIGLWGSYEGPPGVGWPLWIILPPVLIAASLPSVAAASWLRLRASATA